ncbi:conjugal transfer protein TraL [Neisseria sp. DTU_2020_1000833_1_SI_GRL_NUU_006]|uniref:conjugal transfer protein TraL n=1 Tax=Neisseria sicca TaxID=490 RepID=UPI0006659CD7|nr:conjugal transfer protein TraL [Neisseria sicca]WNU96913.1 conjugal transfer protein TraL [Neisseria sp. DTU_2020_1000833_1_SI_GRL_NUU_006]VTX54788.1 Uncharacterised protein [Neisseria sicca]
MKEAHIIVQGKGGVGKSLTAAFLADYFAAKAKLAAGEKLHYFDTDPVNQTFARYNAFKPTVVEILTETNNIDSRFFDDLIEKLINEKGIGIVDNGAATFVPLMAYLSENQVPELLAENGVRLVVHVPVTGGQALDDCMTGLNQTLNGVSAKVVVWLNEFQGKIEKIVENKRKTFTEFAVYESHKDDIIGIVTLPQRNPDTFGADIRAITSQNMSLTQAVESKELGIMPRQRIKTVQKDLYEQLDEVPFLATKNTKQADGAEQADKAEQADEHEN